jgi:hypothetical protein
MIAADNKAAISVNSEERIYHHPGFADLLPDIYFGQEQKVYYTLTILAGAQSILSLKNNIEETNGDNENASIVVRVTDSIPLSKRLRSTQPNPAYIISSNNTY